MSYFFVVNCCQIVPYKGAKTSFLSSCYTHNLYLLFYYFHPILIYFSPPALSGVTSDGCNCMRYSAILSASSSERSGYFPVILLPGLIDSGSIIQSIKFSFVGSKNPAIFVRSPKFVKPGPTG